MNWEKVTDKELKQEETKIKTISIEFLDGKKIFLEYSTRSPRIMDHCLWVYDPDNYSPAEVHVFPLSAIRSFTFDIPRF